MVYFNRRPSVSTFFSWFAVLLLSSAILLAFGFWYQAYRNELAQKHAALATEAERLSAAFNDTFDYTAKYVEFVGDKIAQRNATDLDYIASFISGSYVTRPQEQNLYITTTFDWVTPDKQLRVSSKLGVLRTPFDMSDRHYLAQAQMHPWTLQISDPRYGGLSKQWIIPAGMGITNKHGKFIGSITLGFALDGLNRRIMQIIGPTDVRYILLTERGVLVMDSAHENSTPSDGSSPAVPPSVLSSGADYLEQPIAHDGFIFSYVKPMGKYPLTLLVGYPAAMPSALFSTMVLGHLADLSGIAAASLIMLYLLRRRLVAPVAQLARAADRISKGLPAVLPHSPFHEMALLSEQLQKVSDHVQNEQRINQELVHKTQLLEISSHKLEVANAEALSAAETARKANEAKSEFLANMSHELRTPMNAVIGLTQILLSKEHPPEKRKEFLQVMQTSAQHLMQLINDLLDISKFESGQAQLENIPFDLRHTIEQVIEMTQVQVKQKNIALRLSVMNPPPSQLVGDPHRLQQVLINLLGNAVKFTEKGSVTVELDCRENPITRSWDVTIAVADTGIGIPPAKLASIFEKFTQADSSISRTHGGTGLGLSICRMIMEMMDGKIWVESNYGQGSRFMIEFPLDAVAQVPAKGPQPSSEDQPAAKGGHILLVEDQEGNVLVATALLDLGGYSYEVARNGKEALAMLQRSRFDLVLMDVQMPEMDGQDVTRIIRMNELSTGAPRLPVIGITAHAFPEDRERCLNAGMDDHIAKPFDPAVLQATIARLISRKRPGLHLVVA